MNRYLEQILWTPASGRPKFTPIQDALDAMERGEEVNLSIPFDDTVEMFQYIEHTELLKCTSNNKKPATVNFRYVSDNVIKYIDENNKFSVFPIHTGKVRVVIDSLETCVTEVEEENNPITVAYCNHKEKTKTHLIDYTTFKAFSEQLREGSTLIESNILNALETNENLKNNAITNIMVDIYFDGLEAILFADIYYLDINLISKTKNTPDALSLPPIEFSIFTTEVIPHNTTLIPMWKVKHLSMWNTSIDVNKNISIDVDQSLMNTIRDELKTYFDNSDEILLNNCIIVHNIKNNVKNIWVIGSYRYFSEPMGSADTVTPAINTILNKILDNR